MVKSFGHLVARQDRCIPWRDRRRLDAVAIFCWLFVLTATLGAPYLVRSSTLGDDLTRYTIRLALLFWMLAVSLMLQLRKHEWYAVVPWGRLARWCWTFAWATYLVHLAMAFHFYHAWSHTDAMDHTREISGAGEGIYVSHLFTLVWTLDVIWWWLSPALYAARPLWVGWLLHAFMVFIIFNGTVVYETGVIRWAGVAMFAWLALVAAAALAGRSRLHGKVRDEPPPPASSP